MKDKLVVISSVLALILIIGGGIYVQTAGPCWMFNWTASKDIPGRCMMGEHK
jgi:hypothetical protein